MQKVRSWARLATEIARVIRGKHKPTFTPHMDTGDNVIVINASKIKVTGRKLEGKLYYKHTGYMGHERFTPLSKMLAKHPERVIENAVYGMLPQDRARPAGPPPQAPCVRRHRASARRAAADGADLQQERGVDRWLSIHRSRTPSVAGRKPSVACTFVPVRANGRQRAHAR